MENFGIELLTGQFKNTLDENNRVSLPSKLRLMFPGNSVVITQGFERCVWIFPLAQWIVLAEKVSEKTTIFSKDGRVIQRRLLAPAQIMEIDKTGRLAIPQALRDYAGLNKECYVLGIKKRIEIWDIDEFNRYMQASEDIIDRAAEALEIANL
jgi:MraZ protein